MADTVVARGVAGKLPRRDLFDVVATNDVATLLTCVRGVNPFDVSPGTQLMQERRRARGVDDAAAASESPVGDAAAPQIDPRTIAEARDAQGNSALHLAAGLGHRELVMVLLTELNCVADVFNEAGFTPLHLAASCGRLQCVQLLLQHGANPLLLTRYDATRPYGLDTGRTSLFLAHWHQHHAVVAYLLPHFEAAATLYPSGTARPRWPPRRPNTAPTLATPNVGGGAVDVMAGSTADDVVRRDDADDAAFSGSVKSRLLRAVLMLDTLVFAQVFDVALCARSACGPLPLPWAAESAHDLRHAMRDFLPHIIPTEGDMMVEQLFILEGLLEHGLLHVRADASADDGDAVRRILCGGQVAAFRILLRRGLVTVDAEHRYSTDATFASLDAEAAQQTHPELREPNWEGKRTLQQLLREAEARAVVRACSGGVARHPSSRTRRAALSQARAVLRELQEELQRRGLAPLETN